MDDKIINKMWIPFWVDKWIFGSTRLELEPDERSVWLDLLALASKNDGYIRANEETPYPEAQLAGLLVISVELLQRTIAKCIQHKKLTIMKNKTLYITNWEKYSLSKRHKRRFNNNIKNNKREENRGSQKRDTMSAKADMNKKYINQSQKLGELILKRKPDYKNVLKEKKKNWVNWANDFRLIAEVDKRDPKIIDMLIELCQKDSFWRKNICSPGKLRKQYDRLTEDFARDIDQRLRKEREKETEKMECECRKKEDEELAKAKYVPQEKIHEMVEKALKSKKPGGEIGKD